MLIRTFAILSNLHSSSYYRMNNSFNFYLYSESMTLSKKNKVAASLTQRHPALTHTENIKVISHVQRESDDWQLNTLMLDGVDVPFKYKRKKRYKNLKGNRVNITYYPDIEKVADFDVEIMKVVRIKVS